MIADAAVDGARVRVRPDRPKRAGGRPTFAGRVGVIVRGGARPYLPDFVYVELDPVPRERVRKVELFPLTDLDLEARP